MRARVYLLRSNGRRVRADLRKPIAGYLQLQTKVTGSVSTTALHLHERDPQGSRTDELVSPLYEPVLVALGTDALLMRGFESVNGAAFVQEWRCVFDRH
ncbi:hypothetical protein [Usitatibacter palustris]|uniref:Uncharacterized protein n=1 Tax=Usitatibacter palustris TaxID=2732487 RepID=A0A6M4H7C2_9PROT|nr:hypothetical protein [Usitatibacter palustris]QJR14593.1 hypothetical protein DSM104440_01395 [Usitatibacter palustris]